MMREKLTIADYKLSLILVYLSVVLGLNPLVLKTPELSLNFEAVRIIIFLALSILVVLFNGKVYVDKSLSPCFFGLFFFTTWYLLRYESEATKFYLSEASKLLYCMFIILMIGGQNKWQINRLNDKLVWFSVFLLITIFVINFFLNGFAHGKDGVLALSSGLGRSNLAYSLFICSSLMFFFWQREKNIIHLMLFIFLTGLLILTYVRGAILCFITFLALYAVIKNIKYLIPIFFMLIGAVFFLKERILSQLFHEDFIRNITHHSAQDMLLNINLTGRLSLWEIVLNLKDSGGLFGMGSGKANFILSQSWVGLEQVHSDYIKVYSELGFVGLGLFLIMLLSFFLSLLFKYK
ncbi:TPA: O-antigen ligase family protein, partial [Aeromonas veronii]